MLHTWALFHIINHWWERHQRTKTKIDTLYFVMLHKSKQLRVTERKKKHVDGCYLDRLHAIFLNSTSNINKTNPRTKFEDSKMRTTLWGPVEMFHRSHSQKEQFLWELDSRLWMEVLARQEGQFVGVLARCRNAYRSGPVPVQVAHLEGQPVKKKNCKEMFHFMCVCVWVVTSEQLQLKNSSKPEPISYLCKWSGVRFAVLYTAM